ncbi:CU044_5270 family protein [Streptosporangium sp. NBC_01639]|uniref:CU044_5270 family protein n=1 Tax=Streptosporangium sp. NBC_01639 TaxID=2975948 RepID=UPI003865110A|nr:CU044_5270 family protein [Streptosporangium sp. NBC_01639]
MSDIDNLVKAIDLAPHAPEQGPGARELREAIMATQARPPRTARRLPWRAGAIGLAAAAAGAAVFLGQVAPTAAPSPTATPGVTSLSGASILLAAATKAETAPEGAYWHIKELYTWQLLWPFSENNITYRLETSSLSERWVAKDGRTWLGFRQLAARPLDLEAWRRDGSPTEWAAGKDPGPPFSTSPDKGFFFQNKGKKKLYWSAMPMTLKEIEALPADPEALKKRALEAIRRDNGVDPAEESLPRTLASLLYELPASPQVRSAAYRALATLPAVQVEGPTTDPRGRPGIAVTFLLQGDRTPRTRLIIDLETSKVLAVEVDNLDLPDANDRINVVLESGWTDTKPFPLSAD